MTPSLRRLTLAFILVGGTITPAIPSFAPSDHLPAAQDPKSITVYVTRAGCVRDPS